MLEYRVSARRLDAHGGFNRPAQEENEENLQ